MYRAPVHTLPPEIQQQVDLAYLLANGDFNPDYLNTLLGDVMRVAPPSTPPSKTFYSGRVFDNLYYLGLDWVGAWALDTEDGIILFDALSTESEARDLLLPGMRKLGLDPARIKTIVIMHGHYDHFGGAAYVQNATGARVLMAEADWTMLAHPGPDDINAGAPVPRRDGMIADGSVLRMGSTQVHLYLTPGHTPGTVSAIFPVKDRGVVHQVGFFGGNGLPKTLEPTATSGGLLAYRASLARFTALGIDAGVDAVISNHPVVDNALVRIAAGQKRGAADANPWVVGTGDFIRVMGSNIAATDAAIAAVRIGWMKKAGQ